MLDAVAARPPSGSVAREPALMAQTPVSMAQPFPGRPASGPRTNRWTTRPRRRNLHETVEALYLVPFVLLNIVVYVFNVCGGSGSWGTGVASYHETVSSATTRRGLRQRAWYFVGGLALCAVLAGSATVLTAPAVRTRGAERL